MRLTSIPNGTVSDKERTNLMTPGGLLSFSLFDLKMSGGSDPSDPSDLTNNRQNRVSIQTPKFLTRSSVPTRW